MSLDYNLFNIIILFGAIQGFILCIFLNQKRNTNPQSVNFFLLFLFSLAFFNLIYALLDMDLFKYYRPLHMFPFPYKWLIGPGFYFYIKYQFPAPADKPVYHRREWYLLAPAVVYLFLRTYWFSIAVKENSYRITQVVVESNFFRIHEYFFLFFTLYMGIASLRFLNKNREKVISKSAPALNWLSQFSRVFIGITFIDILLYTFDLVMHSGIETFGFYYATLIINAAFIYWIGFRGFTRSHLFFNKFKYAGDGSGVTASDISVKLEQCIREKKVYLNPNFSLSDLSRELAITPKELSKHINDTLGMNFSEYINMHRVEEVKQLMTSEDASKYTLVSLSEKAGFSSKSSFNAAFKKITGMTPTAYKKKISEQ